MLSLQGTGQCRLPVLAVSAETAAVRSCLTFRQDGFFSPARAVP
jgi:hypothetical protein